MQKELVHTEKENRNLETKMDNQENAKWIFLLCEPTEANRVLSRYNFNKHREESRSSQHGSVKH